MFIKKNILQLYFKNNNNFLLSKKILFSIFIFVCFNSNFILSNSFVTLPFYYFNKNSGNSFINTTTHKDYFESLINYTAYTTLKLNNKEIKFHITLDRHSTYISEKSFNEIVEEASKSIKEEKLYSLEYI